MTREEFLALIKQYSNETSVFSFTKTNHPAYCTLRAEGTAIVPWLLERLKHSIGRDRGEKMDIDNCPWLSLDLLRDITYGECLKGFPEKHAGMLNPLRKYVLKWGKDNNYLL